MNYEVYSIPPFDKQLKRLARKYPSLKALYYVHSSNCYKGSIDGLARHLIEGRSDFDCHRELSFETRQ